MNLRFAIQRLVALAEGPIARSSVIGVAIRIGGMSLIFAQAVIAARMLGPAGYGTVNILLAVIQLAACLALFGFGSLAVAELPRAAAGDRSIVALAFVRHASGRMFVACFFALPVTYIVSRALVGDIPTELAASVLITVPILAAIQLVRGVSIGLGKPTWAQLPGEILRPALLVLVLLGLMVVSNIDAPLFMALYAFTAGLALVVAVLSIGLLLRRRAATRSISAVDGSGWNRAAWPFLGLHVAAILQVELSTLVLGIVATPADVGLFHPIARVSMLLLVPFYALNLGFNPRVAEYHAEGRIAEIADLSRKYTLAATVAVLVPGIAIGLASPWLLRLFGSEFAVVAPLVWFLVAGRVAQAGFGPAAELLMMTGNTTISLKYLALALTFEALLAAVLVSMIGIAGAAIAIAIALAFRAALFARATRQVLGIGLAEFWRYRLPREQDSS